MSDFEFDYQLSAEEQQHCITLFDKLACDMFAPSNPKRLKDSVECMREDGVYAKLSRLIIMNEAEIDGEVIGATLFIPDPELYGNYELIDDDDYDEPESARLYIGNTTELNYCSVNNVLEVTHFLSELVMNSAGDITLTNIEEINYDESDSEICGVPPTSQDQLAILDLRQTLLGYE